MIILYKLVDLTEMCRIKIITLDAEVSFNRFSKQLRLICVSLGGFRIIIMLDNPFGLRKFLILRQDSVWLVSELMSLQNFSQLACDSILRLFSVSFCDWLMRVFTKGSCVWEYCRLSLRFSLISPIDSSETGWLSGRPFFDVGMALSTAVLIAVTIKSVYLSISCADLSSGTSLKLSAASRVDSNTSLSVWSNVYLMGLVCMFLWGWASIEILMGRWMPRLRCLCCLFSCPDAVLIII